MVIGIGVDLLNIKSLHATSLLPGDVFLKNTYTQKEIRAAAIRADKHAYFAARFSGKEAVFKSLGISGENVSFCEIEILSDETGRPVVTLYGKMAEEARKKGIGTVLLSISYDGELVQTFAVAESGA